MTQITGEDKALPLASIEAVQALHADLADWLSEFNDDPDAAFGEYATVGKREWDGEHLSFVVSGNGAAVRITLEPEDIGRSTDG